MKIKVGDRVKTLVSIEAIKLYSIVEVTDTKVNHKYPIEVVYKSNSGLIYSYYAEDELTHA